MIHARATVLSALLTGALLWLAATPARADGGIGTVGVVVTGESTMQPQLVAQLETWLRTHGYNLVSAPVPPEAINTLIDCFVIEDQGCALKVIEKRAKPKAVVFAQINVTAGATAIERKVTLKAYWLAKGKTAVVEERTCERCTPATLRSAADDLMLALAGASSGLGRVRVTSTPEGAKILFEGGMVGVTPLDYNLPYGEQRITIEAPGRVTQVRKVTIQKGETTTVDVTLALRPPPKRKLPIAVIGVGVVAAAAGGVLWAVDQDKNSMPTPRKEYFDSAPGGVALLATGAATIGVGVFLLARSGARRTSTPTATLLPGGGAIGWAGRF